MNEIRAERMLRMPAVLELVPLDKSTIYRKIAAGEFPKPVALGGKAVVWMESDIAEWQQQLRKKNQETLSK